LLDKIIAQGGGPVLGSTQATVNGYFKDKKEIAADQRYVKSFGEN
jgi:hypothetical protein